MTMSWIYRSVYCVFTFVGTDILMRQLHEPEGWVHVWTSIKINDGTDPGYVT